jgi:DNA adenine methylase
MLWRSDVLERAATALRGTLLKACDFESAMENAGSGDVVYCDPTYTVAHDNNGFVRYNDRNFSWPDQERLAAAAFRAAGRGALVVVSNANHAAVRALYRGASVKVLSRNSNITPKPALRRPVQELVIQIKFAR